MLPLKPPSDHPAIDIWHEKILTFIQANGPSTMRQLIDAGLVVPFEAYGPIQTLVRLLYLRRDKDKLRLTKYGKQKLEESVDYYMERADIIATSLD